MVHNRHRSTLSLILGLSRAVRRCQREKAFCENVTFSQFVILDAVGKKGFLELCDLHGLLAVEKSTTTRLLAPLVHRGLIVREKSQKDSRAVKLRLTGEGQTVLSKVWSCLSRTLNAIEFELPEDNRAKIFESVRLFSRAVEKVCAPPTCDRGHKSVS
jgi:DNA-binding MarR family transcriptional regulator